MTKEEIKKRLECTARITRNDLFVDAYNLITEQDKEIERLKAEIDYFDKFVRRVDDIRWYVMGEPVTTCKTLLKYIEIEKKQAQIDILNRLKEKLEDYEDHCLEMHDWQGQTAICECEEYIDELIKEIENDNSKSN